MRKAVPLTVSPFYYDFHFTSFLHHPQIITELVANRMLVYCHFEISVAEYHDFNKICSSVSHI